MQPAGKCVAGCETSCHLLNVPPIPVVTSAIGNQETSSNLLAMINQTTISFHARIILQGMEKRVKDASKTHNENPS
tara:strand:- start:859 stop:1086 length:228 start_codon:yes stop_codon:yes gene_type:complete